MWRCEARRGKGKRGVSCHLAGKQTSVQSSSQGSGFSRRSPAWRREAISALSLIFHFVRKVICSWRRTTASYILAAPKKAAPQLPGLHPRRNHTATVHAWPPACLCPGGSCQWLLPCNSHPEICSGRCPEAKGQPSSWKNRAGTPAQMSCSCPMTLMK